MLIVHTILRFVDKNGQPGSWLITPRDLERVSLWLSLYNVFACVDRHIIGNTHVGRCQGDHSVPKKLINLVDTRYCNSVIAADT